LQAGLACSSVLELLLRSTDPLPANQGSDALVAEQLGQDATRRRSTTHLSSFGDDFNSSDETGDTRGTAGDSGATKGSTLLHRLLTEDTGRMVAQLTSGVDDGNDGKKDCQHFTMMTMMMVKMTIQNVWRAKIRNQDCIAEHTHTHLY